MEHGTQTNEIAAIEILVADRLVAYVIPFRGYWDMWEMQPGDRLLRRIGTFSTRAEAVEYLTGGKRSRPLDER